MLDEQWVKLLNIFENESLFTYPGNTEYLCKCFPIIEFISGWEEPGTADNEGQTVAHRMLVALLGRESVNSRAIMMKLVELIMQKSFPETKLDLDYFYKDFTGNLLKLKL